MNLPLFTAQLQLMKFGISIIFCQLWCICCWSQTYNWQYFKKGNKLSNTAISGITEDRSGYLWLCTSRGLTRFDGNRYVTLHPGISADIPTEIAPQDQLYRLRNGEIAFIEDDQYFGIIDPVTLKTRRVHLNAFHSSGGIIVFARTYEDGYLYACLESDIGVSIVRFDGNHLEEVYGYQEPRKNAVKVSHRFLPRIFIAPIEEGRFFLFDADKGYYILDIAQGHLHPLDLPDAITKSDAWPYFMVKDQSEKWLLSFSEVPGIFTMDITGQITPSPVFDPDIKYYKCKADQKGNMVFTGVNEDTSYLFFYNINTGACHPIKDIPSELLNAEVWSNDFESYIILASGEGFIYGMAPDYEVTPFLATAPKNIVGISMRGMAKLANGRVLVSTERDGIFLFDPQEQTIDQISSPEHWPEDLQTITYPRNLLQTQNGDVWLSAYASTTPRVQPGGYLAKYQPDGGLEQYHKLPFRIESMSWTADSSILALTYGGLYNIHLGAVLTSQPVSILKHQREFLFGQGKIVNAGQDRYWIGTTKGLFYYDHTCEEFSKVEIPGANVSNYLDIYSENENTLWIGTYGEGLYRYHLDDQSLQIFDYHQGLNSDAVCGIVPMDADHFWLSTYNGLYCFDKKTGLATNPIWGQGAMHTEYNRFSYLPLSAQEWLFGGMNGFQKVTVATTNHAQLSIQALLSFYRVESEATGKDTTIFALQKEDPVIRLPAGSRWLQVGIGSIEAPDLATSGLIYRLSPLQGQWAKLPENGEINFSFIPPGTYALEIADQASEAVLYSVPISAAYFFYERITFKIGLTLALLAIAVLLVYLFFDRKLIREKALQLEESEQFRQRLFAYIAHEFKTPLTVISGIVNRLKKQESNGYNAKLEEILKHGNAMAGLVNQMLELNQIQLGDWQARYEEINVNEQLKLLCAQLQSFAESLEINLHYSATYDSPFQQADAEKINAIATNLLSNAIKFSPKNGTVSLRYEANASNWTITVQDQGPGVAATEVNNIFHLFYQGSRQHDKELPNSGVGLSYVKAAVEAMNGRIEVSSEQGAIFKTIFPVQQNDQQSRPPLVTDVLSSNKAPEGIPVSASPTAGRYNLLIVEDNPDIANYLISCFSNDDHHITWARDGEEGAKKAIETIPDIIVSDVRMPRKSGFDLCREVKSHPASSHIPIVLLTALSDTHSKIQGLESLADAYIAKPFNEQELTLTVSNLLNTRDKSRDYFLSELARPQIPTNHETPAPTDTSPENSFIRNMNQCIEAHYNDPLFGVAEMADHLFLSRTQLHRKTKALTGENPGKILRLYRLRKAADMLRQKDYSISAVAYECGFKDPSYFTKAFSTEYGTTPSLFRQT